MKYLKSIALAMCLGFALLNVSAQEFIATTDNYLWESIEKSVRAIENERSVPENPEISELNQNYLRAPNSYIYDVGLAKSQNYGGLKIPVTKAFAVWESSEWYLNQSLNSAHILSAFIYWEDVPGLIQDVDIENASPKSNSKILVKINPKKGKGNAVISLHLGSLGNSQDPIVWSWHVWVTDDPSQGTSFGQDMETDLNESPFVPQYMDRNLGAVNEEILGDEWHKSGGLMYQWGRKDPIPPLITKDFSFHELNGLVGYMRNREGIHSGNIIPEIVRPFSGISSNLKFSIQNPIAYMMNNDSGTWFSSQQYKINSSNPSEIIAWDLWGDNMRGGDSNANSSNTQIKKDSRSYELKSPYDPCPNGWRIPSFMGRTTTNNNLGPWGRKNSGFNDDENPEKNSLHPNVQNTAFIGAKIHNGIGIDFTDAHDSSSNSRDIGIMPTTGFFKFAPNGGQPSVVFQDESAIAALWTATYSLGGARYLRVTTDPLRPDLSEYGLNQVLVNQTTSATEALAVRCMRDPNHNLTGNFSTEYISATKTYFTDGLDNPNSYIVHEETEMLIPVNKAFSAYENLFPEDDALPHNNLIANVYWTDNPNMVQTVKLIGEGDPRQKFIRVQLNAGQKGNAVISLHNNSVNTPAYWSWHIWAVADEIQEITYVNQEILPAEHHFVNATGRENPALTTIFMDRNLGAIHDLPVEIKQNPNAPELINQVKLSGGLHYQWGRKDPIPSFRYVGGENYEIYRGTSVNANGVVSYSNISQTTYINQFTEVYSDYHNNYKPNSSDDKHKKADKVVQYSIQNPLTFLHHATTEFSDWVSNEPSIEYERWGHAQKKSVYDPCPDGWRVPDTFKVHENGRGSSPWYNGKKLESLQGNPQFIGSHYGGEFFQHDNKAVGWFFNDQDYQIGYFPTTGIIGKFSPNSIGGTSVAQAITGVWTAAMTQQLKGFALAMSIGKIAGSDHKMISTGNVPPAYGLNVRCAKDYPRYEGIVGEDYFEMSTNEFTQNSQDSLKIYPNPVKDFLNISSPLEMNIEVFNLQGQLIKKGKFENSKINLSDLQKGVYIGLIYEKDSSGFTTVKIIKL